MFNFSCDEPPSSKKLEQGAEHVDADLHFVSINRTRSCETALQKYFDTTGISSKSMKAAAGSMKSISSDDLRGILRSHAERGILKCRATAGNRSQNMRRVKFNKVVKVLLIPRLSDYDEASKKNIWWSEKDIVNFRERAITFWKLQEKFISQEPSCKLLTDMCGERKKKFFSQAHQDVDEKGLSKTPNFCSKSAVRRSKCSTDNPNRRYIPPKYNPLTAYVYRSPSRSASSLSKPFGSKSWISMIRNCSTLPPDQISLVQNLKMQYEINSSKNLSDSTEFMSHRF